MSWKQCREMIESKLNDSLLSAVFAMAVALQTKFHSPANFWEILGVCQRCLHVLCRPRESIGSGSSWKGLWSVAGARYWRPPVIGYQVTVFLIKSLYPCQESLIKTVQRWCSTPTRVCAVILHELDRQSQPSRWGCHSSELQDQPFTFWRFGTASIFSTESSACTRSVIRCVRPNRNENQHLKYRGIMSPYKSKTVYAAGERQSGIIK